MPTGDFGLQGFGDLTPEGRTGQGATPLSWKFHQIFAPATRWLGYMICIVV
jgi:hypothetical protein